jgi:hypothetical protein
MSLKFAFLILAFSLSAFAQESDIPIVAVEFGSEPLAIAPIDISFEFREGGRHWSSQELEADNIQTSFSTWLTCYRAPGRPECNNCESHENSSVTEITNVALDRCLPARSDLPIAYASNLDESQRVMRDRDICSCYRRGEAGPFGDFAFSLGSDREGRAHAWQERKNLRERQEQLQATVLADQARQRLITERFQTSFSAASYGLNAEQAVTLGAKYSSTGKVTDQTSSHASYKTSVQSASAASAGAIGAMVGAQAILDIAQNVAATRPIEENDFTSANLLSRPGFCVPYRHFLASKQYPDDNDFFADLRRQDDFDWKDFNYPILLNQFQREVGRKTIKEALVNDREGGKVRRMYQRIKFLYDNPVFKNIFQAPREYARTKNDLINLLRSMPSPSRGTPESMQEYRRKMSEFLMRQDAIDASRLGAENSFGGHIQIAVASARQATLVSDVLRPQTDPVSASQWRAFCDEREAQERSKTSKDVAFVLDLENSIGRRNFENPELDEEYADMNNQVCTVARTGPSGQKTFQQFLTDICGARTDGDCSIESRPNLVGRFLREFPNSPEGKLKSFASLTSVLNGSAQMATVSSDNIRTYNRISSDPVLSRTGVSFRETAVTNIRPQTTQSTITPVSQTDLQAASNTIFAQPQPIFVPQAEARAVAADVPAQKNPISQAETEAQGIRNEISSLREILRREPPETTPGSSQALMNVTKRLAQLENRLAEKEQEIQRLRNSSPSQDDSSGTPSRTANQISSQGSSRSNGSAAAQAIVPPGGASAGVTSQPTMMGTTGGSVFSGISSPTLSRGTPTSNGNSALLAKYGVREVSEQGGITVASSSGAIDYQQLRSETENNILPLTVTSEEFNLISQNNQAALSRYLDQVKALPGEVVRINLSSGERTLEVFVLKSGDQVSFVQAPSVAAQRSPASVVPDREFTLKNLQNELTN